MKLRTEIELTPLRHPIRYADRILLVGSCFTDHIGAWLNDAWLSVLCNPWGVLFNPASIAQSLLRVCQSDGAYLPELHQQGGRWYSFDHHGSLSGTDPDELTERLIRIDDEVRNFRPDHILVTFGTSWVYERGGNIVANCHKFPASDFTRRQLSVQEIVDLWAPLAEQCHLCFTVSPIRHVRDGLHGNQLSKATLLLAIDALQQLYPERVDYLPVYELLIDDLRDYRFYAEDLVHPSPIAIQAVREFFAKCAFTTDLQQYMREAEPLVRAMHHRPSDPDAAEYKAFFAKTQQQIAALKARYAARTDHA